MSSRRRCDFHGAQWKYFKLLATSGTLLPPRALAQALGHSLALASVAILNWVYGTDPNLSGEAGRSGRSLE